MQAQYIVINPTTFGFENSLPKHGIFGKFATLEDAQAAAKISGFGDLPLIEEGNVSYPTIWKDRCIVRQIMTTNQFHLFYIAPVMQYKKGFFDRFGIESTV